MGLVVLAMVAMAASGSSAVVPEPTGPLPDHPPSPVPPAAAIVTPHSNMPDPFVFFHDGTYYLYSSDWGLGDPNVPVRTSKSLSDWGPIEDALPVLPKWASPVFTWAPDVRRYGHRDYVLYFTAMRSHAPFDECIGYARGSSPLGPFHASSKPMICQLKQFGAIDPRTFIDASGQLWMVWKSDNDHQLDGTGHTWIWSQRLAPGGLHLVGPRYRLLTANRAWEGRIVEAPAFLYKQGVYWLFFSGNWFNQPYYAIGVARCVTVHGPCTQPLDRPWLASGPQGQGPGEESVFVGPKGNPWLLYAPWCYGCDGTTSRPVAILRIRFDQWGPYVSSPPPLQGRGMAHRATTELRQSSTVP